MPVDFGTWQLYPVTVFACSNPEIRMPSITIEYSTDAQRLALEQAIAYFTHMRHLAATAPDGTVLAACEQLALTQGRALLRDTLAAAVQDRADATTAQKKSARATKGDANAGS